MGPVFDPDHDRRRLPGSHPGIGVDLHEGGTPGACEYDSGCPPPYAQYDRPGSHGSHAKADLPGDGRSRRKITARQAVVLPVADVLPGMARLAERSRTV